VFEGSSASIGDDSRAHVAPPARWRAGGRAAGRRAGRPRRPRHHSTRGRAHRRAAHRGERALAQARPGACRC